MHQQHRGASVIEYIILIVMFLTAILVMQKQIARGMFGRWKSLGDTFGHGEQYDPATTLECGRHVPRVSASGQTSWGNEIWYERKCFECCRYINAATGNYAASCSGFLPSGGTLAECRSDTSHPSDYGKSTCCAQGCKSTTCENLTP